MIWLMQTVLSPSDMIQNIEATLCSTKKNLPKTDSIYEIQTKGNI